MDILLNSLRNIKSTNVDNIKKIEISTKASALTNYDAKNIISATEVFDTEREANGVYRIHGRIEYMSMLNGLRFGYGQAYDFFLQSSKDRTIFNSFEFYLLRPKTLSNILDISGNPTNNYIRIFEVIGIFNDFELLNAGFSNNTYGEQLYNFCFNKDFDVSQYFDSLGFPITELFLYVKPVRYTNKSGTNETLYKYEWNNTNSPTKSIVNEYFYSLTIGDIVYGDLITYDKANFTQNVVSGQTYFLSTTISVNSGVPDELWWKFNPFIPLTLGYFSSDLQRANSGSTSYDVIQSIPDYATQLDGNNFVWREILPQGYFDPITDLGVDYPFVNKRRYLFSSIVLDIIPDLSDSFTLSVFNDIKYNSSIIINENPKSSLNEIGKPC